MNPVWYVDSTHVEGKFREWPAGYWNDLIQRTLESQGTDYADHPVAKLASLVEAMGTGTNRRTGEPYRTEFWWEREWRHIGDFVLPVRFVVLAPESEFEYIASRAKNCGAAALPFVDPGWSLEEIIARLAGSGATDVNVFAG